jgi:transcriptional regulator NrdR family protein
MTLATITCPNCPGTLERIRTDEMDVHGVRRERKCSTCGLRAITLQPLGPEVVLTYIPSGSQAAA